MMSVASADKTTRSRVSRGEVSADIHAPRSRVGT